MRDIVQFVSFGDGGDRNAHVNSLVAYLCRFINRQFKSKKEVDVDCDSSSDEDTHLPGVQQPPVKQVPAPILKVKKVKAEKKAKKSERYPVKSHQISRKNVQNNNDLNGFMISEADYLQIYGGGQPNQWQFHPDPQDYRFEGRRVKIQRDQPYGYAHIQEQAIP